MFEGLREGRAEYRRRVGVVARRVSDEACDEHGIVDRDAYEAIWDEEVGDDLPWWVQW